MQKDGQKNKATSLPKETEIFSFYVKGEIPRHTLFIKPMRQENDPSRIVLDVVEKDKKWVQSLYKSFAQKFGEAVIDADVRVSVIVQTKKNRQTSHMAWSVLQALEGRLVRGEVKKFDLIRSQLPEDAEDVFTKIFIEAL